MGWEKVAVEKPHFCEKPYLRKNHPELSQGDVIRCTDCGQHWKITGVFSGMQWDPCEPTFEWEKVSPPVTGNRQWR